MAINDLVPDASVVAKWYLRDEQLTAEADAIRRDLDNGRWNVIAPGHLPYEVVHAILRAGYRGRLNSDGVERAITLFEGLLQDFDFVGPQLIAGDGARLASTLGVNFFDACYLQVARVRGARLLTADEAFFRQAGSAPDVFWLGDYPSIR